MNTDKYEGHTEGKWDWLYNDEVPVHLLVVPQDVIGIGVHPENNVSEADMKLIADAPLLLEEYVRVTEALRYVGVSMYLDKNNYRHYDYGHMLDYIMEITREPDDLSGQMGAMIQDVIEE